MSLITIENMHTLLPAQEAKSISDTAIVDQQIAGVAYAINTAANSGETECLWSSGELLPDTIEQLESQDYTVKECKGPVSKQYIISFENA